MSHTSTSDLKFEHDGKTDWLSSMGCLLQFRDEASASSTVRSALDVTGR